MIYLDNSATTAPDEQVIARMNEIDREYYFNQHAFYRPAIKAEELTREAADTLAKLTLGADAKVIFTSGGTESDNLAIVGSVGNRKGHVLTTMGEHPAVYEVFKHMEMTGRSVSYAPLRRDGSVDAEALTKMLQPDTLLVSVMSVSNETGAVNDLAAVKKAMRTICPQAVLHTDAVQGFGHIDICADVDMCSVSSHKIHGPKGAGALIVKKSCKLNPILYGGGQQENLRSGTLNTTSAVGTALAARLMAEYDMQRMYAMKRRVYEQVLAGIPDTVLNGQPLDVGAPHVLSMGFADVRSEVLLHMLEDDGILISAGSACSTKKGKFNRVLHEMHVPDAVAGGSIRVSFGRFNTEEECDIAAERIVYQVKKFRRQI